ncbi:hypothetical protein PG997_000663 [Apiospora hydei]|uniref:VWFA domain-containing protein n=1 Tax=Apiospora hydei TaxID=1337664 RepID=A0ABR1XBL1_9PEZI
MADDHGVWVYVDNSVPDDELENIKAVVRKLKPRVDVKTGSHALRSADLHSQPGQLRWLPLEAFEILKHVEDGQVLLKTLYEDLEASYTHSGLSYPRSFVYLTNGASHVANKKSLKNQIITAMVKLAKRNPASLPYRRMGITFVQFGNVDGVQDLFDSLDNDLQEPFEARLKEEAKNESDKDAVEAVVSYFSQTDDVKRKEDYYQRFDIVDYVRVNSVADVNDQMLKKIIMGAIDPNLD